MRLFPHTSRKGFTLLLAALIASIVLALGTSIFEIAQKQFTLSSIGRNSQFAFYVADTIAECALYWDFRFSYFSTTTPENITPSCDSQPLGPFTEASSKTQPYSYPYTLTSTQRDLFGDTNSTGGYCAQVSVNKTLDQTGVVRTLIRADGYSVNCSSINTSAQALQRSIELHY